MYGSKVKKCVEFIKKYGFITHRDIILETGVNCPYSVLRSLKKRFKFMEVKMKNDKTGTPYTAYVLESSGI